MKRLIALPGEWMQLPGSSEVVKIPEGHCWVEGDNSAHSWDSRAFGPVSYFFSRSVQVVHVPLPGLIMFESSWLCRTYNASGALLWCGISMG